jgi:hypothetical protein
MKFSGIKSSHQTFLVVSVIFWGLLSFLTTGKERFLLKFFGVFILSK